MVDKSQLRPLNTPFLAKYILFGSFYFTIRLQTIIVVCNRIVLSIIKARQTKR